MFAGKPAVATVAVKDIERAQHFYEETLGLPLADTQEQEEGTRTYKSGDTALLVYESQYAGSNKATAVTWAVGDVAETVRELKSRGVSFETYDMPGVTRRGEVHVTGSTQVAWFKDPDGNIHAVVSG
jgi:catechol 2,3-dioxygenase-like lactoylglutathione lyase family enzyme